MYKYKIQCQIKLMYYDVQTIKKVAISTLSSKKPLSFPNPIKKGDVIILNQDGSNLEERVQRVTHRPGEKFSVIELETKEAGEFYWSDEQARKRYKKLLQKYKFITNLA